MKKKLICLLAAAAMVVGMSACSDGSAGTDTSSSTTYNMTLTLWLPTSESTTSAAIAQVQSEINKITKKNYKTAIEIHAVPDDEYDEAIKARVIEVEEARKRSAEEEAQRKKEEKEARKNGETIVTTQADTAVTEAATVTGEDGSVEEVYPSVTTNQLDIFCIRGYDEFAFYAENGHLSPLDESIDASSKLLKSYVYPTFLEWGKLPGDTATIAVLNNHVIGEYKYLLVNKKLCESLYYDPTELTTLLNCEQFIEDVGAYTNVTPLLSSEYAPGLKFWNSNGDTDSFSILGTLLSDETDPTSRHNIRNVFGLKQFNNTMIMMKKLSEKGYIASDPSSVTEFGVGVISCDGNEIKEYENDYYINVIECPRAETDDVYQSMFAVSTYTEDVSRCMEIITLINTDTTVRTLLQYGVEGIHWEYNEEKTESGEQTIKLISDDYKMNLIDTGNVFITYPGENIPMSYWDAGKQQNLDSLISPFLGFTDMIDEENEEDFAALDAYSAKILQRINAMTAEEYEQAVDDLKEEVADSLEYSKMTDSNIASTLVSRYISFHDMMYNNN